MAADITKSQKDILEQFVLGRGGLEQGALTAGTYTAIKGLYIVAVPTGTPAALAAGVNRTDEITITSTANTVRVAVGDVFVPLGEPAGEVVSVAAVPAVAKTIDKVPVRFVNQSAGSLTPTPSLTRYFLWIKLV